MNVNAVNEIQVRLSITINYERSRLGIVHDRLG
jgi:hypothetical protein